MPEEQIRCNICGMTIIQSQAGDHTSTTAHAKRRSELERDLGVLSKEQYDKDSSVVISWASSL